MIADKDIKGQAALHVAMMSLNDEDIQILLKAIDHVITRETMTESLMLKNKSGGNILHVAVGNSSHKVIVIILN